MKTIGLTGGIASGKSTVAQYLRTKNIPVMDADSVAKNILRASQNEVVDLFGASILSDGKLDTGKIRRLIFADADKKTQLENLLHPKTKQAIRAQIASTDAPCVVVEVPLLFEAGWVDEFDAVWLVHCTDQLDRLLSRDGIDAPLAQKIIDQQNTAFDTDEKMTLADAVIKNNADIVHLHQAVDALIAPYLTKI